MVVIQPMDGVYEESSDFTISGTGTLKATGTLSVPLASDYYAWLSEHGLTEADPEGDLDGDGTLNVLEYILDGNPTVPGTANMPASAVTPSGDSEFSFVRRSGSKTITTQTIEYSTDLVNWTTVPVPSSSGGDFTIVLDEPGNGLETVTLEVDTDTEDRMFFRLRGTPQ